METNVSKMDDLHFADDIALVFSTRHQLQQKNIRPLSSC